jgi:hypothetical protein
MKLVKTVLNESEKNIVVHFYIEGEQNDNELVNFVLLDPATDFAPPQQNLKPTILQIWRSLSWFDLLLKFEDSVPEGVAAWVLTRDTHNYDDFRYFGGLKDRGSELDGGSGKLLASTNGFIPGSVGTFVIAFKKD